MGNPGNVTSDDHFNWEGLGVLADHCVWIRNRNEMVRNNIGCVFEPPGRKLVEHLAFVRHRRQHPIEGRKAVGCNDQTSEISQGIPITYLARLPTGEWQI